MNNVGRGFDFNNYSNMRLLNSKVTGSDPSATDFGLQVADSSGTIDNFEANDAERGVSLSGETPKLKVSDSTANGAGIAGFEILNGDPLWAYNYILTNNTANDAASFGFTAVNDVGGDGNHASGAGTEDCHNVPCV